MIHYLHESYSFKAHHAQPMRDLLESAKHKGVTYQEKPGWFGRVRFRVAIPHGQLLWWDQSRKVQRI